ncbi:OLC1v1029053C1 [Oldenlandia corymbosa var. corymbosa]|nr:OLC1v1029053C1 [Oldenlandia corymbosa var. corymbosa]
MATVTSTRVLGSWLCRFSNGVSLKPSSSFTYQSALLFRGKLSSCSHYSTYGKWVPASQIQSCNSARKIRTFAPLCMGRRSCKIAGRKTAQDAKKGKLCSKIGKQVVSAVKRGGTNPVSNPALAALFEKAKELDVPKEIVERNIKRALEKGQETYTEKIYEIYGFGGAGVIVEVSTDNTNRSIQAIRGVIKDHGGKMADSGSLLFKFKRARVANIKVTDVDKDELLTVALDAGAEDVIEPPMLDDDSEEDISER